MATITFTNGAADGGKWTTAGNWDLARAPLGGVGGDDVIIPKNLTATLDTTGCVAKSVKIDLGTTGADVGGKLVASTTADSKLQVYQGILVRGSTTSAYNSEISLDMSSAAAYTCVIAFNDAQLTTSSSTDPTASGTMYVAGRSTFKGATRTRWTFTQSALVANTTKSVVVDDATGWKVGDILVFATTQAYNATPRVDKVTIDTITPGSGTTATVTWVDGTGTGGAVLYGHDTSCLVGNFSSNLRFVPTVANKPHTISLVAAHANNNNVCDNVEFYRCHASSAFGAAGIYNPQSSTTTPHALSNCAFYDPSYAGVMVYAGGRCERTSNVYYAPQAMSSPLVNVQSPVGVIGDDTDTCVFMANISGASTSAMPTGGIGLTITRPKVSGVLGAAVFGTTGSYGDSRIVQGGVWSSLAVDRRPNVQNGVIYIDETYIGKGIASHVYASANNAYISQISGSGSVNYNSCLENLSGGTRADTVSANFGVSETRFYNKDGDPAVQEIYSTAVSYNTPVYARVTDTTKNANASLKFATLGSQTFNRTFSILVKGGADAIIYIWARKSSSSFTTRPTAQLTGLGTSLPEVAMPDVNDTWELLDLSYSAGSAPTSDGLLTLTLKAASTGASDTAYFSGIPLPPFTTRCRHYGYVFDETSPLRTINGTVQEASESVAYAYTGFAVTGGASTSSTVISANNTFQKFYDYGQAWGCASAANIGYVPPVTGAGVAGSPSLFAQGNITINTTKVLNGAGSLSMGSYTLSSEFASGAYPSYTYTGGTWSQLSSVPTFSSGTLAMAGEGAYVFVDSEADITFAPTANGVTYNLGGCTFSGTINLHNTSATRAITIEVPTGTSYTTSTAGGTITVTSPAVYQSVTISGATAGTRIQIYDTTSSTELYNGTPTFPHTWTDGSVASATRAIRLRAAYQSTVTAKKFIDTNIGTCAVSGAGKDISYLVSQEDDTTYIANAIDGSGVTDITIEVSGGNRVKINKAGGSVTWPQIYAYQVYWQFTSTGIAQETAFIDAPDTANYLLTDFDIKNTHATVPLTITGGWGRDSTTLTVAGCIDTTGTSIFPEPDHVVAYATGSALTAGQAAQLAATATATALESVDANTKLIPALL